MNGCWPWGICGWIDWSPHYRLAIHPSIQLREVRQKSSILLMKAHRGLTLFYSLRTGKRELFGRTQILFKVWEFVAIGSGFVLKCGVGRARQAPRVGPSNRQQRSNQ